MEAVLAEVLEELRQVNKSVKDQGAFIKELDQRVLGFEEKLRDQQVIVQPPDLGLLDRQIADGLLRVAEAVEKQPKPIQREFKLWLFPEFSRFEYYRLFIRWVFGVILGALLIEKVYELVVRKFF